MSLTADQVQKNGVDTLNRLSEKASLRRLQAERLARLLCEATAEGPCRCDELLRDAMRYAREVGLCPNHPFKRR